ncbi:serine hydrolase domain-containing protein [Serinibacter salmoneus]|uniref:D-alanyl-D-alanine carboxypeptidase n=1 Tax=Serinibacter salmoneus TaxID=556530 RepID=A0A2A9D3J0_9MICO|nr:serine hydrolase domain-containing protein [Serinibacter salmoneus]PFG20951.1 D-alanyl-D-alanine carboxypeptidase [Serinibacter salmoneus]
MTARTVRDPEALARALRRATDNATHHRARRAAGLPAPQVLVDAPGLTFTSGETDRRFHAASVGKMMTATLAFDLAERGRLDLDAPVTALVPEQEARGLFAGPGVTPRHLLTHTSGAADYFEDPAAGIPFPERLRRDPEHRYTPEKLLAITREHQHPVAAPGERFHYSDTGYVLLARILEEAGGAGLGAQLHERIFTPAGMGETCLLFHTLPGGAPSTSPTPGADLDLAPLVVDGLDLSRASALSCDWGGGGVVTTLADLRAFAAAWRAGALIGEASRAAMTETTHRFRAGIRYGAGAMRLRYREFFPLLFGMPSPVGHLGVTGAHLFFDERVTLVLNAHSTAEMTRSFRLHIRLMQATVRALR